MDSGAELATAPVLALTQLRAGGNEELWAWAQVELWPTSEEVGGGLSDLHKELITPKTKGRIRTLVPCTPALSSTPDLTQCHQNLLFLPFKPISPGALLPRGWFTFLVPR